MLTRWRTEATEAVRRDPEPVLARRLTLPVPRELAVTGDARLSADAPDTVLDTLAGVTGPRVTGSSRLAGAVAERGSAALDGDPSTWWSPAFGDDEPALLVESDEPLTFDHLDLVAIDDGRRSLPARIRVEVDGTVAATVAVPDGGGRIDLPAAVTGRSVNVVVEEVTPRTTIEWFSGASVVVPPAIAELGLPGAAVTVPSGPVETGCRDDLVTVDGDEVAVRVRGRADRLGREPLELTACGDDALAVGAGEHEIVATDGATTGLDVDRLVLRSGVPDTGAVAPSSDAPRVSVRDEGRAAMDLRVEGATPGEPFWLVLGQSHNLGWSLDGEQPELVDGFANGWLITPTAGSFDVRLEWRPQRVVNVALAASAVAALGCLALVVLGGRRRRPVDAPVPELEVTEVEADLRRGRRRWPTWAVTLAVTAGTFVAAGPVVALVAGAATVAGDRSERAARLLRWSPATALALAAAYIIGRQAISRPTAAFEWPAEQTTAHGPALAALALLAVTVVIERRRATPGGE